MSDGSTGAGPAALGRRPFVLVLMATYNGARWLPKQVDSILRQAAVDLEVCVSDDGSTDASRDILTRCAGADARVRLLPADAPRRSAGANFRRLIVDAAFGSHTHVAFSDQDDEWQPRKLAVACERLHARDADLYSSAVTAAWSDGRRRDLVQASVPTAADFLFEGAGQGCTFVMTAALYLRVRNFIAAHADAVAQVHYHDWLVYALARSWQRRWTYDPVPRMLYRQHGANDTGAQSTLAGIRQRVRLIGSGWYGEQVARTLAVCRLAEPGSAIVADATRLRASALTSLPARWRWAWFTLVRGRRRWRDRAVVFAAALAGRV